MPTRRGGGGVEAFFEKLMLLNKKTLSNSGYFLGVLFCICSTFFLLSGYFTFTFGLLFGGFLYILYFGVTFLAII